MTYYAKTYGRIGERTDARGRQAATPQEIADRISSKYRSQGAGEFAKTEVPRYVEAAGVCAMAEVVQLAPRHSVEVVA